MKNSLKLNVVRNERIRVRGFGGGDESPRNLEVVPAKITDIAEKSCTEVELYVVPVICSPICDQKIEVAPDTYNHLTNLRLADSSSGESELKIDALIGANYYWDFITNKIVGESGPVAV